MNILLKVKNLFWRSVETTKLFFKTTWYDIIASAKKISIESIGWTAMIALQVVTIPNLLGLMSGLTDNTPPIDMVTIMWAALGLFYLKALLQRDIINLAIIGLGFLAQSILMALVFFK